MKRLNGIILDVTQQELAKNELEGYRNLLEKAQDLARIGYWEYHYHDQTLEWSDKVYEIFGLSPDTFELTLEHFMELIHPDDRGNLKIAQEYALRNNTLFESEYRLIKPNGEIGHFQERGEFVTDNEGRLIKLAGAVIDITSLKKAEHQLRDSEQTYRLLFKDNPLPGFIYDLDNLEILEVNQAAVEHYGYSEKEFVSLPLESLYPPEDIPALHDKLKHIDPKFSASGEWTHIAKDGKRFRVEIISAGIQYQGRNARQVIIKDITKQKEKERDNLISMIKGQDRERKRIAMDLHDSLAQYLTAASLNLSSVSKQVELLPPNKQEQFSNGLSLVKDALWETRDIAQNLMPRAIEDFGLIPALLDLFNKVEQANSITVNFYQNIDHLELERQIEINIYRITQEAISNALRHSGATCIDVETTTDNHIIYFSFSDNGKGYNSEKQENMRHGLGLSNMHLRAESMSATLNIYSKPDNGTSITLKIPYLS